MKTSRLIDLTALTVLVLKRRALVAAVSNDQCDDITRRAALAVPRLRIDRFVASGETRSAVLGFNPDTVATPKRRSNRGCACA